ncbi:MAG: NAD-dependent epimerase/dehydratase family protein [Flavobacteriales bacterium]|nr:NAD-dependent epimerase/dehydratase family protein [Flavobacteriales bacterium]
MKIFLTGAAGFIGFHLSRHLLQEGFEVLGIDNLNAYYDLRLKTDRLAALGISDSESNELTGSSRYPNFHFSKTDITDAERLDALFLSWQPDVVIHLAAQAGVRYSIDHPESYVHSNLEGFFSILQAVRKHEPKRFLYASSSSVYGMNKKVPFSETDTCDSPVSFYAATKKSNEVMAHSYASLYGIPSIGLRFFTVYGTWGRPDMAYYKFALKMQQGQPIDVYNDGKMRRDFTYIEDVCRAILELVRIEAMKLDLEKGVPHQIFNIGHHHPVELMDFITTLEQALGMKAQLNMLGMQAGDVTETYADPSKLKRATGLSCNTYLKDGLENFANWFHNYHPV